MTQSPMGYGWLCGCRTQHHNCLSLSSREIHTSLCCRPCYAGSSVGEASGSIEMSHCKGLRTNTPRPVSAGWGREQNQEADDNANIAAPRSDSRMGIIVYRGYQD